LKLQLSQQVAIVTGAGRGIGRAIAQTLAAEGMKLAIASRSGSELESVAATLGTDCLVHVADLRDPDAPAALVRATLERFGHLDVLVNNAGATKRGDFLTLPDADWIDGFALKFYCAVRSCRAAWPHLIASRGSIVNIVGIGGRTGSAEFAIGGAVNAALLNLTKVLADRGTRDGVRVNAINPGWIATDRLATRVRNYAEEHQLGEDEAGLRLAQGLGIARFGQPAEIGRVVAFLGSPQSGYLQGSIVDVDGGQTRTL
jgi:NAD(P)-dependent dehydrogenase (short-subunit alcohol dehydrogenase family)